MRAVISLGRNPSLPTRGGQREARVGMSKRFEATTPPLTPPPRGREPDGDHRLRFANDRTPKDGLLTAGGEAPRWVLANPGRSSAMIAIERLTKSFETRARSSHLALADISLDVADGRVRLDPWTFGLRQVDASLYRRRLRAAQRRAGARRGQAGHWARPGPRAGVPGVRAVSLEDRARQCDVRPARAGRAQGASAEARRAR